MIHCVIMCLDLSLLRCHMFLDLSRGYSLGYGYLGGDLLGFGNVLPFLALFVMHWIDMCMICICLVVYIILLFFD